MNKLIPHIEYLLQSHDCVIIPGLGAVLAHGIPAFYDESRGVWVAPRRAVAFNPELSRTDGLLAASVARRDSLNIESATTVVRNEVDNMRKELELTGRLQLGSAGTLDLTAEGNLSFTPGDAACLSPSFAWLPSFAATPLESASELARRREATERKETWLPYLLRKGSRIAAAAAVLLALGWIVVQNLTYAPDEQFASVAPMTEAVSDRQATPQQMSPVVLVLARAPKDEVVENIPPLLSLRKRTQPATTSLWRPSPRWPRQKNMSANTQTLTWAYSPRMAVTAYMRLAETLPRKFSQLQRLTKSRRAIPVRGYVADKRYYGNITRPSCAPPLNPALH